MKSTKLLISLGCLAISFQAHAQLMVIVKNLPKIYATQNSPTSPLTGGIAAQGIIATFAHSPGVKNVDPLNASAFAGNVNRGNSAGLYTLKGLNEGFLPSRADDNYSIYAPSNSSITKVCDVKILGDGDSGTARPFPYSTGYCKVDCVDKGTALNPSNTSQYQMEFANTWVTNRQGNKCTK